jgi:protein ImuB
MFWIALLPLHHEEAVAWGWRALQFTPRVAGVDEAILLEVGASERLFGGRGKLLRNLLKGVSDLQVKAWAAGETSLTALSLLRLKVQGQQPPAEVPQGLPLHTFTAAEPHLHTLERIGCNTLGQLCGLPRAGVSRRFGAGLLQAIDCAVGHRPERFAWWTLPPAFDQKVELAALATSAPDLLFAAQHLLTLLQVWLQARNLGVLGVELEWTLDLRRLDGKPLPPTECIALRTAQPTQDMKHLRRLASEQLARSTLSAPANQLRLRTLQTVPWGGITTSLLPEDHKPGEKLHQFVERLSVRLGAENVVMPQLLEDHRPECMQAWVPAGQGGLAGEGPVGRATKSSRVQGTPAEDALYPTWLLRKPQRLEVKGDKPCYQGPLQLLTRARRIEAAWWEADSQQPALRDYFIARSPSAGLLWIFRERLAAEQERPRWFLHGLYA